jgi:hypothetical protein
MALIIKDRVKEITTTTGTGAVSLGGASATFDAFQSVMSNGDTTFYAIVHTASGTDEWEVGLGTWNTGNTLTRTTVYAGSNGTSAVNFSSGNKDIFMTYPASKAAVAGEDVTFADITATDITSTGTVTLSADPSSALQAATKQYVDTIAAAGIHYHTPVRVEHPSNLNATYNNGSSGVGATLTNAGTNAALVLDNVSMVLNDRVLVANQTDQTQNGVYTVTTVGDGSTAWVLTRSTDTDSYAPSDGDSLGEGDAFFIKEGDTNAGHLDVMTTSGTITFGTTNIVFSEVAETSIYSAGTGLTLTGTTFSTNQDISTSASPTFAGATVNGNITVTGTVDGRDVATDGSKLDGIEAGATADQTASEIKTAYESNSNTNAFTDAEQTKLSGIETGATADQTASEILTAIKTVDGSASGLDADLLDGQQGSYYLNTSTTFSGDVSGTYNNIVVANDSHTHDGRYYTETEADSRFVNVTGDTMTGDLLLDASSAEINLKSGVAGTSGAVNWTFNTTGTNYASIKLPYDTRGTIGLHIDSGYPITIDATTRIDFDISGTTYATLDTSGLSIGSNDVFHDGYHPNADKWTTARTLTLSGDASGSVSWDGSANATLSVSVGDADTVDGVHGSSFLRSDTTDEATGKLTFDYAVSNLNSVSGSRGVTPFKALFQASNRPGNGNYATGLEFTFHDTGARTQLVAGSDDSNTVPTLWARAEQWSASSWSSWYKLWHSGNDGSGSGLDADNLDGRTWSTTRNSANTLVTRDGNGYTQLGWINTTSGATTSIDKIYASADNYIRYVTPATFRSQVTDGSYVNVTGDTMTGKLTVDQELVITNGNGTQTHFNYLDGNNNYIRGNTTYIDTPVDLNQNNITDVNYLTATYLRAGDGNDGYFFSDTNGRTAFAGGDFYIQSIGNYYNYATNQYHGNTSGDNHYFRGNTLSGNSWSLTGAGAASLQTLTLNGSVSSGATDYGYYQSAGTNLILKGDSVGRSGIFFESEKDGTNINDPSDYGFIQFHSYGYGNTSGEANNLVIGVANDSTDQIILQVPYSNSVKVGYRNSTSGTGLTLSTVWHSGNDGSGSGLDADTLDGVQGSSFVRSDASDTLTGATYTLSSSTNEKLVLSGSTSPYLRFQESTTNRAYIQYDSGRNSLKFQNQEAGVYDIYGATGAYNVNIRLCGPDGDIWGSLYAEETSTVYGNIGFLDDDGSWAYKINADLYQYWYLNGVEKMSLGSTGLIVNDSIYVDGGVYHRGDTDTYLAFGTNTITLATGGSSEITIDTTGVRLGDTGNGYFQPVSGNYGSVQIDGGAHTGWEGYSIGGRAVFMHNNSTTTGLYNDVDNEWLVNCTHNGPVYLYHNGTWKLQTSSTGVTVSGTVAATSYTGDGSSLTGISAGATGGGSDEIFWENGQNVTTNYTITNGKNAMSAGPITINSGVTVTVGAGETWTVV